MGQYMQQKQSKVLFERAMGVLVEGCSSASHIFFMNYNPFLPIYAKVGDLGSGMSTEMNTSIGNCHLGVFRWAMPIQKL